MSLPFQELPAPPSRPTPGGVLARLTLAVGFRYRWATEGLETGDLPFRPAEGSYTLEELLVHIHGLLRWTARSVGLAPDAPGMAEVQGMAVRRATLEVARALADHLADRTEADLDAVTVRTRAGESYPFWNLVNGPLADALTHIGQVSTWRRILGRPAPAADVFRGLPPRPS